MEYMQMIRVAFESERWGDGRKWGRDRGGDG